MKGSQESRSRHSPRSPSIAGRRSRRRARKSGRAPLASRSMEILPVLVTGGAGYIGSHAVLALKDASWPVAVIDDLSNGTRSIVPEDVPFYEGTIADRALVERIFAERKIGAIM